MATGTEAHPDIHVAQIWKHCCSVMLLPKHPKIIIRLICGGGRAFVIVLSKQHSLFLWQDYDDEMTYIATQGKQQH